MTKRSRTEKEDDKLFISTGSTLLNLAISDKYNGGYQAGSIVNMIGDSSSGKTFATLTTLAEACYNPKFDNYDLFHDDVEARNNFNMGHLFGSIAKDRIDLSSQHSNTIQEFRMNITKLLESEKPFIDILDSMDALTSEEEIQKFEEKMDAYEKGKTVTGSYGMSKAKENSEILRNITRKITNTKSLLIIISQTRDNIGLGFAEKTRSGGKALRFYSDIEMWMATMGMIKKTVHGRQRVIGVKTRVKVKKNSITGKQREIDIPIYYDYGIDDIESCVDFLIAEKEIERLRSELNIKGEKQKLIREIEDNNLERKLQKLTGTVWNEIEDSLKRDRKRRYE